MHRTIYQGNTADTLNYLKKYFIECDREFDEQCTLVDLLFFPSEAAQKYQVYILSKCPQTICKLALAHEESEASLQAQPAQLLGMFFSRRSNSNVELQWVLGISEKLLVLLFFCSSSKLVGTASSHSRSHWLWEILYKALGKQNIMKDGKILFPNI